MSEPGLDSALLWYLGHDPEVQKSHQRFYLPFFAACRDVVDFGCGNGDFVELLIEQKIGATGVDTDPKVVQSMQERGLPVVHQDALAYLRGLADGSIDGVFASHLVEHLPYEDVVEMVKLAYRALKPGGLVVLTTPDPRSLFAHLEMFYLHFGHVAFYHPRLLCLFLRHVGFVEPQFGSSDSPVQARSPLFGLPEMHPVQVTLPIWRKGPFWQALRAVRMAVAYLFLRPHLDLIHDNFQRLSTALQRIDRPFECYVKAIKPRLEKR